MTAVFVALFCDLFNGDVPEINLFFMAINRLVIFYAKVIQLGKAFCGIFCFYSVDGFGYAGKGKVDLFKVFFGIFLFQKV